ATLVAEELGQRHTGERNALAGAGRLIHLAEDQGDLIEHIALAQVVIEVVAFASPLAHAREDRVAAVLLGDIADQLLDADRLANPCSAKDADLAAARKWSDKVDHLQARLEHLRLDRLLDQWRRRAVDR